MHELFKLTMIGLFFGTIGTFIGGLIGVCFKNPSNKFLSFILSFASGIMLAIICFDLIPETLNFSNLFLACFGIVFGILIMIFCDCFVQNKLNSVKYKSNNNLLKTGILVGIGLAIHNIPEGLAICSGFGASLTLGYSLAISICFHDVPEGISMAVPMKNGGMKIPKVILYVLLSGFSTGIGSFIGAFLGSISKEVISLCLSFASGAMLYIVSGELIPESNKLYNGRLTSIGNMLGFIIGLIAINL